MSTLSQFAPFAGGGLKSFQTGYVGASSTGYVAGDNSYLDVTVSSVNTAKAIPGFYGGFSTDLSRAGQIYTGYFGTTFAMPRMTSATNLRIGSASSNNSQVVQGRWQIAEAN